MVQEEQPWTVLRLLEWTESFFRRAEVDSPRLCAEVLLAHVLGCQRIMLYTRFDYVPAAQQLTEYRDLVKRAGEHQPVAYLVGHREFYSLRFKVDPNVLVPRPETEQLVSDAVEFLKNRPGEPKMWDICTGSGCIAISTAVMVKNLQVLASDICEKAVEIARQNAENNNVASRVSVVQADMLDLPADCELTGPFDVITVNPPYVGHDDPVGAETKYEPRGALYAGSDGMECINRLIPAVGDFLVDGGLFLMEFGQGQADKVYDLLNQTGQFYDIKISKDFQGIERAVQAVKSPMKDR